MSNHDMQTKSGHVASDPVYGVTKEHSTATGAKMEAMKHGLKKYIPGTTEYQVTHPKTPEAKKAVPVAWSTEDPATGVHDSESAALAEQRKVDEIRNVREHAKKEADRAARAVDEHDRLAAEHAKKREEAKLDMQGNIMQQHACAVREHERARVAQRGERCVEHAVERAEEERKHLPVGVEACNKQDPLTSERMMLQSQRVSEKPNTVHTGLSNRGTLLTKDQDLRTRHAHVIGTSTEKPLSSHAPAPAMHTVSLGNASKPSAAMPTHHAMPTNHAMPTHHEPSMLGSDDKKMTNSTMGITKPTFPSSRMNQSSPIMESHDDKVSPQDAMHFSPSTETAFPAKTGHRVTTGYDAPQSSPVRKPATAGVIPGEPQYITPMDEKLVIDSSTGKVKSHDSELGAKMDSAMQQAKAYIPGTTAYKNRKDGVDMPTRT